MKKYYLPLIFSITVLSGCSYFETEEVVAEEAVAVDTATAQSELNFDASATTEDTATEKPARRRTRAANDPREIKRRQQEQAKSDAN